MSHVRTTVAANGPGRAGGAPHSPVLLALAAFAGVASVASIASRTGDQWPVAAVFACMIALGEAVRVRLPNGRDTAPLGVAVGLGYAVVTEVGTRVAFHDTAQAVAVAAFGFLVGSVPHQAVRRPPTLDYAARRFLSVALAAWLFRMCYLRDWRTLRTEVPGTLQKQLHSLPCVLAMAGAIASALLADAVLGGLIQAGRDQRPFRPALRDELRVTASIGTAVGATALLVGLACRAMSIWILPILCVPLFLTQLALRRYSRIKAVHLETIRALSRITEVAGYSERGHARRVARMAHRIGRELGLSERELLDLEYAALMHDIGQLSLTEPVFGGRTVDLPPPEQRELALAGAEVIRSTRVFDTVAEIVELQAEPFGAGGPLGSRILRVANAFDDLAGTVPEVSARVDALDTIRHGLGVHYDPVVVESLTRIVLEEH